MPLHICVVAASGLTRGLSIIAAVQNVSTRGGDAGQMASLGNFGTIASGVGGAMMSYRTLRWMLGMLLEMSSHGDCIARPAAGELGSSIPPRFVMGLGSLWRVRRSSVSEQAIPAPDESPVMIILDGDTAV